MAKMSPTKAIKTFFEQIDNIAPQGGRKVTFDELKPGSGLTKEDRHDLGRMCAASLNVELDESIA